MRAGKTFVIAGAALLAAFASDAAVVRKLPEMTVVESETVATDALKARIGVKPAKVIVHPDGGLNTRSEHKSKRIIDELDIEGNPLRIEAAEHMEAGKDYTLVLRPEAAHLADQGGLPCKVVLSCFMGSYQNYHVMVGNTLVKLEEHNPKNKRIYQVGESCRLVFEPESVHIL